MPFQYTNNENYIYQHLHEQYLPETGTSSKTMRRDIELKAVGNFTLHKLFTEFFEFCMKLARALSVTT